MKQLSIYQKAFILAAMLFSFCFFYYLHNAIAKDNAKAIMKYAIIYGAVMMLNGIVFGYNDFKLKMRYDIAFRYNLLTYITVNFAYLMYSIFSLQISVSFFVNFLIILVSWGFGVFVHYYFSKKTLKGLDVEEVFM
jgi:hypothetical protein